MKATERAALVRRSTQYGYFDRGTGEGGRVVEVRCPVSDCTDMVRAVRWVGDMRTPRQHCAALHDAVRTHLREDHP